MTIDAVGRRFAYAGDGTTVTFAFNRPFELTTDLKVYLVETASNIAVLKSIAADYSVSGAGTLTGGSVTMNVAPSNLQTLVIFADTPQTHNADISSSSGFPYLEIENVVDRLTTMVQELSDRQALSPSSPRERIGTFDYTFPIPVANKYIGFNASGNALEVKDGGNSNPAWGTITGTLASQTDLVNALSGKSDSGHTHAGLAPAGGSTGWVLKKNSASNFDYGWAAEAGGGGGAWGSITGTLSAQTDLQAALDAKAALLSPTFTGTPSAPTAAPGTNTTQLATTGFVKAAIDVVLGGVGAAFDTLSELATAIGTKLNSSAVSAFGLTLIDDADAATARGTLGLGSLATQNGTFSGASSGTNTGDQTSIVGITGTKAQFNTAVTDGDVLYVGDVTQYTDEAAQDAIGLMLDSTLVYVDATPSLGRAAITGHITIAGGSNAAALGSFTMAQLDTAVSDGNVSYAGHTHLLANVTDVTMTVANLNALDDGVNTALHFHDADRARANHTGTQTAATISDFSEAVDDRVAALLVQGSNVTLTYNDAANTLTIASTAVGGGAVAVSDEGSLLTAAVASLNFVGAGVVASAVGAAVTVTVSGGGDVVGPAAATDNAIVRYDTATGKLLQDSGVLLTDANEIDIPLQASPTAPAADRAKLLVTKSGGRLMPMFIGPNGQKATVQPHVGKNKLAVWNAAGNSTTITAEGQPALTATGTATAVNVAQTNALTRRRRLEYLVTVAATTAVAGFRAPAAQWTIGDPSLADQGGFHFVCIWGTATGGATSTHRAFVGMANSVAAPTDVEPSTITNIIGMGWDAADTNVQLMYRGAGAVTKVDLGASFPVPSADRANAYMLEMYSPPGTTQKVGYKVTNVITDAVAEGEVTTNLPTTATYLAPRGWMSVGGTSSVIGIALSQLYVESDW